MNFKSPLRVTIELTNKCNHSCIYCYHGSNLNNNSLTPLTVKSWKKVLEDLYNAEVFVVSFSGGEPTLYQNFLELLQFAKELDFDISVSTNGTRITDEIARALSREEIEVQVTIHGVTQDIHNYITRRNTFKSLLEGVRRLKDHGVELIAAVPLNKLNIQRSVLEDIIRFCIENEFVKISFFDVYPFGNATKNYDLFEIPLQNKKILLEMRKKYHKEIDIAINIKWRFLLDPQFQEFLCSAALTGATISYDGLLKPCPFFPRELLCLQTYNVLQRNLTYIWQKAKWFQMYRSVEKKLRHCKTCKFYQHKCLGGCRVMALKFTGDFFGSDPSCPLNKTPRYRGT